MRHAFISYAREDAAGAARIAAVVEGRGWSVWWDPDLSAGQAYDEEIQRHLHDADAVVVLWSRASAASRWVKAEADVGMERGVLIPARLDDTEIPLPFHRLQTADLTGWDGTESHPGIAEIRRALSRVESGEPARAAPPGPARSRPARRPRWWIIGATALIVLVAVAAAWRLSAPSGPPEPVRTGTFVVPDVEGMRLDEARIPLAGVGIIGPSLRDADGEPFDDDRDLETVTRVAVISPPPGTEVSYEIADVTLYLEFCDGTCPRRGG